MKFIFSILLTLIVSCALLFSQPLFYEEWHRSIESTDGNAVPFAVTTDAQGNIFVAGRTYAGDTTGKNDAILIKYNTNGDTLWTRIWKYIEPGDPDTLAEGYADIVVDNQGNCYGIIWTNKPPPHPHIYSTTDIAFVKYDSFGNCVDTTIWDGEGDSDDMGNILIRDPNTGDFYVGGRRKQYDAAYQFDRWVVTKFDANLNAIWSDDIIPPRQIGAQVYDMVIDTSGNLFATGYTSTFVGTYDYLTVKYSPDGTVLDSAVYDPGLGYQLDQSTCITMDNLDNTIISGFINTNPYPIPPQADYDFYTIKYDNNLNTIWGKQYGFPVGKADAAADIVCDASGNVYLTGSVQLNNQDYDIWTMKYSASGNQLWTNRYSGPGYREDGGLWIALDSTETELYVVGRSCQTSNQYSNDYILIIYDAQTGDTLQTLQYNGAFDFEDVPQDATIDKDGNIFVTGYSVETNDSTTAITTVKYSRLTGINSDNKNLHRKPNLAVSPNPMKHNTTISFIIKEKETIDLGIYDVSGKLVRKLSPGYPVLGEYRIQWNCKDNRGYDLPAGIYYCRLSGKKETITEKLILIK